MAGAAAATATAVALAPLQITPTDVAVPAQPTTAQPQLTDAMVELLAAASRMTAALAPTAGHRTGASPEPGTAPAALVGPDIGVQNAASDWLTTGYEFIQYWVDYGVELAEWVAWDLLWFVPFSGLIGDQIDLFYYDLIRPIANAIFYQAIVPIVNDPLNPGVWWNGIRDAFGTSINQAIDFGFAELDYFVGWLIPPLPPLPGTAAQALAAPSATPDLRDVVGAVVLPPSSLVTDIATGTVEGMFDIVDNAAGWLVHDVADPTLNALRLGFLSRQLDLNYTLLSTLAQQGVGLTTDLLSVPNSYLHSVLEDRQGLFEALGTEVRHVADSLASRGGNAFDALGDYLDGQIDYFTPGLAATEVEPAGAATVPPSVQTSLQSPVATQQRSAGKVTRTLSVPGGTDEVEPPSKPVTADLPDRDRDDHTGSAAPKGNDKDRSTAGSSDTAKKSTESTKTKSTKTKRSKHDSKAKSHSAKDHSAKGKGGKHRSRD